MAGKGTRSTADRERVIVAMSGGVDSSVAAAMLVEEGYDVTGMMLRLWTELDRGHDQQDGVAGVEEARRVAGALGVPFHVIDCSDQFKAAVVEPFIREYARGRTPNPCVVCNKQIKFGYLLDTARASGASYLATGHYARVRSTDGVYKLMRARDVRKDQSYFLYVLGQEQLEHVLFPLGELTKVEVRDAAEQRNLPVARREESQDICFVCDQDYGRFLQRYAPEILKPGPIVNREGRGLGEHAGLPLYTIGQRRGIGVTWSEPLYVLEKDMARNALIVGPRRELGRDVFEVKDARFVVGNRPSFPARLGVKIRSTAPVVEATLCSGQEGELIVQPERPLRDVTPGQAAVFYRGEEMLGGGTIALLNGDAVRRDQQRQSVA